MLRMTAHAGLNYVLAALSHLRAHRAAGATEHATTSHPDGDADRQQQAHRFVREQIHSGLQSTPG